MSLLDKVKIDYMRAGRDVESYLFDQSPYSQ